jgi:hypothetical protein
MYKHFFINLKDSGVTAIKPEVLQIPGKALGGASAQTGHIEFTADF